MVIQVNAVRIPIYLCLTWLLVFSCARVQPNPRYSLSFQKDPSLQEIAAGMLLEDATNVEKWVEYGRTCILSNNYLGAIEAFRMALEIDKKYMPAYDHLTLALYAIGEVETAAQACREALKVEPESAPIWLRYGYCLNDLSDVDSALLAFTKVIDLPCDDSYRVSALLGCATIYSKQGKTEEAESAFRKATEISPQIIEMLNSQEGI